MRPSAAIPVLAGSGLLLSLLLPSVISAQAPTRLAAPPRAGVIEQAQPPGEATAVIQSPGQPTTSTDTAPTPAPVTQVGPPSGVTQLGSPSGGSTGGSQQATSSSQAAMAGDRAYSATMVALTLGGLPAGFLGAAEGGTPVGEVAVEKLGPDHVYHKHISTFKYEDLVVKTGIDNKPLLDWVGATLAGNLSRKNGSVIYGNHDNKSAASEREFFNARISQVTFPAFEAGTKGETAYLLVSLAPEYTRLKASSGPIPFSSKSDQKKLTLGNFRFEMTGLDGTKVIKIESFTVSQKQSESAVGERRDYEQASGGFEVSDLTITLLASSGQTWQDWLDDFLIQGHNGDDKERSGSIVYLDQSLKVELGRINLSGCGIYRLAPKKVETNRDGRGGIARLEAGLYCEGVQFAPKAS
jgi:hypothetical protein